MRQCDECKHGYLGHLEHGVYVSRCHPVSRWVRRPRPIGSMARTRPSCAAPLSPAGRGELGPGVQSRARQAHCCAAASAGCRDTLHITRDVHSFWGASSVSSSRAGIVGGASLEGACAPSWRVEVTSFDPLLQNHWHARKHEMRRICGPAEGLQWGRACVPLFGALRCVRL